MGKYIFLVDRNNHPSIDFHAPRLNKLVTEVIPSAVTSEGTKANAYKYTERYTAFYRVGSGTQYTKDKDGNLVKVAGGYAFKTGGTTGVPLISDATIVSNPGQTYNPVNGPLPDYGALGIVVLLCLLMINNKKMGYCCCIKSICRY